MSVAKVDGRSLSTREAARDFRRAAKSYVDRMTVSKEKAREALAAIGTHEKNGRIARKFRK